VPGQHDRRSGPSTPGARVRRRIPELCALQVEGLPKTSAGARGAGLFVDERAAPFLLRLDGVRPSWPRKRPLFRPWLQSFRPQFATTACEPPCGVLRSGLRLGAHAPKGALVRSLSARQTTSLLTSRFIPRRVSLGPF